MTSFHKMFLLHTPIFPWASPFLLSVSSAHYLFRTDSERHTSTGNNESFT